MPAILITGASRGFGRELLEVYRAKGWTLFPLVRNENDARSLSDAEHCHPICADVRDAHVEEAIRAVLDAHTSALDVVINNAGHVKKLRWLDATEDADIEDLFRTHCLGALRCTRAALPFLRRAETPVVINVSSRFGSIARVASGEFRGIYSYCIAKASVNMLTACLDQELRKENIRLFAVHPGKLKTPAGAVDADTEPRVAAERLAAWIDSADRGAECQLYDLMEERIIPW